MHGCRCRKYVFAGMGTSYNLPKTDFAALRWNKGVHNMCVNHLPLHTLKSVNVCQTSLKA